MKYSSQNSMTEWSFNSTKHYPDPFNEQVFYFDPKTGAEYALGTTVGSESYRLPKPPIFQDWVLVLERQR